MTLHKLERNQVDAQETDDDISIIRLCTLWLAWRYHGDDHLRGCDFALLGKTRQSNEHRHIEHIDATYVPLLGDFDDSE